MSSTLNIKIPRWEIDLPWVIQQQEPRVSSTDYRQLEATVQAGPSLSPRVLEEVGDTIC